MAALPTEASSMREELYLAPRAAESSPVAPARFCREAAAQ